jgi:hypothetical protein
MLQLREPLSKTSMRPSTPTAHRTQWQWSSREVTNSSVGKSSRSITFTPLSIGWVSFIPTFSNTSRMSWSNTVEQSHWTIMKFQKIILENLKRADSSCWLSKYNSSSKLKFQISRTSMANSSRGYWPQLPSQCYSALVDEQRKSREFTTWSTMMEALKRGCKNS